MRWRVKVGCDCEDEADQGQKGGYWVYDKDARKSVSRVWRKSKVAIFVGAKRTLWITNLDSGTLVALARSENAVVDAIVGCERNSLDYGGGNGTEQ